MNSQTATIERRTSADVVFDGLYQEIISLRMLPGTKISEADVAAQFGVSRQPVRDAFSRLGNLGFLWIRPQKATEVQRFSEAAITSARFIRAAIEVEVVSLAASRWDGTYQDNFAQNLSEQRAASAASDVDTFHKLDYDFHRLICIAGGVEFAFDEIIEKKAQVDRLCVLSMMDGDAVERLVEDHRNIYDGIVSRAPDAAVTAMRAHLARLGKTIEQVRLDHPHFFV